MSVSQQYHNVSVRLNDQDYKQLLFLHDKYNRMSYGKVSLADVLRIAVKELHVVESENPTKQVTAVRTETEQETASTEEETTEEKEDEKQDQDGTQEPAKTKKK
jgi:Ran GTPase-activating protein (RanGAP) involved in mRNA processing and transport